MWLQDLDRVRRLGDNGKKKTLMRKKRIVTTSFSYYQKYLHQEYQKYFHLTRKRLKKITLPVEVVAHRLMPVPQLTDVMHASPLAPMPW